MNLVNDEYGEKPLSIYKNNGVIEVEASLITNGTHKKK